MDRNLHTRFQMTVRDKGTMIVFAEGPLTASGRCKKTPELHSRNQNGAAPSNFNIETGGHETQTTNLSGILGGNGALPVQRQSQQRHKRENYRGIDA